MVLLRWLAAALLLTASLGQLNRLFIGEGSDVVLYINDLLIGVMAVWYLGYALVARKSWRIPVAMLPLVGWVLVAIGGLVLAKAQLGATEWLVSWSYLLRYLAYVLVFFFVAFDSLMYGDVTRRLHQLRWWYVVVLISGLLMAIGGFIQLYVLPDLTELAKYGWDPHIDRLVTAMLDPNYAGCYLAIILGLAVSLYLFSEQVAERVGLLVLISILLIALLLTFSRSGYVMLAVVMGCIALVKSRMLLVVGLAMAIIAVLTVPRIQTRIVGALEVDASAQPRIISWQNSWQIGADNWLLGVGFNTYRYAQDRYGIVELDESGHAGAGADSSWLFTFATTGMVGLLLFVSTYAAILWAALRLYLESRQPQHQALAVALASILIGLAIASQFNNALYYTWIMQPLWLLCGLTVALLYSIRERPEKKAV